MSFSSIAVDVKNIKLLSGLRQGKTHILLDSGVANMYIDLFYCLAASFKNTDSQTNVFFKWN